MPVSNKPALIYQTDGQQVVCTFTNGFADFYAVDGEKQNDTNRIRLVKPSAQDLSKYRWSAPAGAMDVDFSSDEEDADTLLETVFNTRINSPNLETLFEEDCSLEPQPVQEMWHTPYMRSMSNVGSIYVSEDDSSRHAELFTRQLSMPSSVSNDSQIDGAKSTLSWTFDWNAIKATCHLTSPAFEVDGVSYRLLLHPNQRGNNGRKQNTFVKSEGRVVLQLKAYGDAPRMNLSFSTAGSQGVPMEHDFSERPTCKKELSLFDSHNIRRATSATVNVSFEILA